MQRLTELCFNVRNGVAVPTYLMLLFLLLRAYNFDLAMLPQLGLGLNMTILKLAVLGVCFLASFRVGALDKNGNFESDQERDAVMSAQLKNYAQQLNSQTPLMMDDETEITAVFALDKTLNYSVRFTKFVYTKMDMVKFKEQAIEKMNEAVCQDSKTKSLINAGVSFVHFYSDKNGKPITRIPFTKYHC